MNTVITMTIYRAIIFSQVSS